MLLLLLKVLKRYGYLLQFLVWDSVTPVHRVRRSLVHSPEIIFNNWSEKMVLYRHFWTNMELWMTSTWKCQSDKAILKRNNLLSKWEDETKDTRLSYRNPETIHSCWRKSSLIDHIIRGIPGLSHSYWRKPSLFDRVIRGVPESSHLLEEPLSGWTYNQGCTRVFSLLL